MACKSLTMARMSPGFAATNRSMAMASAVTPSATRTRFAILFNALSETRLNSIISASLENRSLVARHCPPLPHNLIGSLQVKRTGCLVLLSNLRSSALPPLSPLSRFFTSSESIPALRVASIRCSLACRKVPERWSTSSSNIRVLRFASELKVPSILKVK